MLHGYLVFPLPQRFFQDLIVVCDSLREYYHSEDSPVRLEHVVTMKRAYLFENAHEEYGEFEVGDQFLLFSGKSGKRDSLCESDFFCRQFPTQDILREAAWEGITYRTVIVPVDDELHSALAQRSDGLIPSQARTENDWMIMETISHYVACTHPQRCREMESGAM